MREHNRLKADLVFECATARVAKSRTHSKAKLQGQKYINFEDAYVPCVNCKIRHLWLGAELPNFTNKS